MAGERRPEMTADEERSLIERILARVSDGVVALDLDWRIRYVNDEAAEVLHRPPESLLGRVLWDEFPEAVDSEFWDAYHRAMRTQEPQVVEAYYGPLDGWFEVRSFPSPDGLTIYFRNVDDRRAADAERTRLIEDLSVSLAWSEQLLQLTHGLASALRVEDVGEVVAEHAQEALQCRFAGVALVDDERRCMRYISMVPLPDEVARVWTEFPLDLRVPAADSVTLGRPLLYVDREAILAEYPALGDDLEAAGTEGMVVLPLTAPGEIIGSLMVTWGEPHACGEQELRFLQTLAGQAAQAIERSRLFARQRSVASTLQQAILPLRLPTVPGVDLVARYDPAEEGAEIGGDWYDAFLLGDGRLMVAVGDVSGHGLAAAAIMGQLRNAARAYAVDGAPPGLVLTKLNHLLHESEEGVLASLVVACLDPHTGETEWSSAGHPPPLVIQDDDSAFLDTVHGPMLGAEPAARYDHERIVVDGTLLLYTDGLIEHRSRTLDDGLAALRQAAAPVPDDLSELGDRVVSRVLLGRRRQDDVCLLVVRRTSPLARPRLRRQAQLASHPTSVREARRLVREVVTESGLDELADVAALLVSELVTNAVLHAGSEVELACLVEDDILTVQVGDRSPVLPGRRHYDDDAMTGRGIGLVEDLAEAWGLERDETGKTLWFQLAGAPSIGPGQRPAEPATTRPGRDDAQLSVRLLDLPVALVETTVQYDESLLRELALSRISNHEHRRTEPEVAHVDMTPVLGAIRQARWAGRTSVDVELVLPPGAGQTAALRMELLADADAMARDGRLAFPPAMPELVQCREWLLTQMRDQAAGAAPSAWVSPAPAPAALEPGRLLEDERRRLDRVAEPVVVVDDGNTIVYANPPATALLGWPDGELVGERLVAIVPPELREAHVAGFSRYLMTNQSRLLGRRVDVPALRRDGSVVDVALVVDTVMLEDERRGIVATLVVEEVGP